jgi:type I restriction enzyme R subunit
MSAALPKSKEDLYAEQPAIEWIVELGWDHEHGGDLAPNGPGLERTDYRDVVLIGRLRDAVRRLNPELPLEAVQRVVELVLTHTSPTVILDHESFHEFLVAGVPVAYVDEDGIERFPRAKLVDFDEPENNQFVAVNQMTIIAGTKNRRPDILLYVNGLPLGQIEVKSPTHLQATPESAVNQVAHYRDTIPDLYRFVEIIGVSDLLQARIGTITTPPEHFAEWKFMDEEAMKGKSALEVMLRGAFAPATFLDLVKNFVLFESDGARTYKVMAKYHQVDAVNRAIEATVEAMSGDGRGGVVWHTQGSGKSYTAVFYVAKARRDPRFENPTFVVVTDRTNLDDQLHGDFARQKDLSPSVRQAENIDGGPESLHSLLQVPAGGIIFTTIQKFATPSSGRMPVLSERRNVIVISDEAHRTQYADLARNLTKALPNATRIGFTGTPIERDDRSTSLTFGDYISVYPMERATKDGATVPIYYESRVIPLDVGDPDAVRQVEEVLEAEEVEASTKLVTSWTRLEKVAGASARLDRLVDDIAAHYTKRCETLRGKAMVVCMSRRIAAEVTERLKAKLGDDAVTCVITAQATDPPEISKYRRSAQEMRDVAEDFKDPDHPLRIVVVRDMWLTGYDAPVLHTLYVDKPMRDHGLLQAIARVNRVFRDKPGGLVVDYIGIGEDLRSSLQAYSQDIADDAMKPLEQTAASKLREKHDVVSAFFHGLEYRRRHEMSPGERATLLAVAHERVIDDEDTKKRFLTEQAALDKWFKLVSPHEPALELEDDVSFFRDVARSVRKYTPPEGQASPEAEQAVRQFFSEGLAAGEVVDIFGIAGEERPEISILSDEFLDDIARRIEQPNLQVQILEKLLNDEIRVRAGRNQMQAKHFSEEIEAVLTRYRNKSLTSAEIVQRLIEIAKEMRNARRRNDELGLTDEETAFYDALAGSSEDWSADPKLAEIARELVRSIRNDLTVDWTSHENTEAAIRARIKRLLRKKRYRPPAKANGGGGGDYSLDAAAQMVLEQARVLYRYWPDVPDQVLFTEYQQFA